MSETVSVILVAEAVAALFQLGRHMAKAGQSSQQDAIERHLIQRKTQLSDGNLIRQVLKQSGLPYQEGEAVHSWGPSGIEFEVLDENGLPWFAFGRENPAQPYNIYSHDRQFNQQQIGEENRLSEQDAERAINQVAQQYGYFKTLQTLLQDGYEISKTVEHQPDGSYTLILQKQDKMTRELHTVRLVFQSQEGRATILTDSRRQDGTHGVCPNLDPLLTSMGFADYEKWISPEAQAALAQYQARNKDHETTNELEEDTPRSQQAGQS